MIDVGSGWDVGYCIAEVSACADFSLLRCLSSAIMSHCDSIRITSCPDAHMEKAWTSVSVAARRTEEKIPVRQESARINASKKNVCRSTHFARDWASAVRSAWQSYTLFCIWRTIFLVGIFYQSECGCSAENYYFCTLNNPAMNR